MLFGYAVFVWFGGWWK